MIQLVVACDPATGAVSVSGPIDQLFLCQGMLAEARRIIERQANWRDTQAQPSGFGLARPILGA